MVLAGVLLVLGGCGVTAPFGGELKTGGLTQGGRRSICVVSALGNSFGVTTAGLTMFGSDHTQVPVEAWKVDEYVVNRVAELIGARFDIHRVLVPNNAFASLEQPGALFRNLASERQEILRKIVLGERCDYHLLVLRASSTLSTTNQKVSGIGIVRSGDGVLIDNVHLFALASLVLYENHSFKILSEQQLSSGQGGIFNALSGPHKKLDASSWPAPPSTADSANMRAGVLALIDAGLIGTLPEVVTVK